MYSDVQSCLIYLSVDMICIDNCLQPSIVCVNDNVRKRVFAIFQGKVGGVSDTYHPPEPATVSTE